MIMPSGTSKNSWDCNLVLCAELARVLHQTERGLFVAIIRARLRLLWGASPSGERPRSDNPHLPMEAPMMHESFRHLPTALTT